VLGFGLGWCCGLMGEGDTAAKGMNGVLIVDLKVGRGRVLDVHSMGIYSSIHELQQLKYLLFTQLLPPTTCPIEFGNHGATVEM